MPRRNLLLRWSWRDLRGRWVQVAAISLVIALGTGTYAGLLSTSAWRTESNNASFALLHVHDLRLSLSEGSSVPEGTLARLAHSMPRADAVTAVRERLVVSTQVAGPRKLLVPGELVGSALGRGTAVDTVSRSAGRSLTAADDGAPNVILEQQFATQNGLGAEGRLLLSGQKAVRVVGQGQSPEYFLVSGRQGALPFLSQKSFAVLFSSLHTAQLITGTSHRVNNLVLTVRPGTVDIVRAELERAIGRLSPPISATVTTRNDIAAYRVLYNDIKGDEELWRIIAVLVFASAAFTAFNLTSRIVEAQRREIGIGMALGLPPRTLAIRPLLFGAQVAFIGVVLGLGVGWLIGIPLGGVFADMLPLPVWKTPFQFGTFAQAAAIGFFLPFAAVTWPVWRAVRVQPVEAIRVGQLAARGSRLAHPLRRLPLHGRSYRHIPFRNVVRTPRRTALTTLGIAVAITTLVTIFGFLDSFNATLDSSQHELLRSAPNRVTVSLRSLQPETGPAVAAVRGIPRIKSVYPSLLVPVTARNGEYSVELLTEVLPANAPWAPSIVAGKRTGGLVLARKAAGDLHVGVGDTISIEHPRVTSQGLRTVTSRVSVVGLHPNPMRVFAYLDPHVARIYGLAGMTNVLTVTPAADVGSDAVRRALLTVPQVASAEAVKTTSEGMRSSLQEFLGILQVAAGINLLLALLIAFNSASIGMDERAREHATMRAFGLPIRTVLGLAIAETGIIGVLATVLGILGGYVLLGWMVATTIPETLPEIGVIATIAGSTLVWVSLLGILTVTLAPLLVVRRLRRMDIPSTLRVVE